MLPPCIHSSPPLSLNSEKPPPPPPMFLTPVGNPAFMALQWAKGLYGMQLTLMRSCSIKAVRLLGLRKPGNHFLIKAPT